MSTGGTGSGPGRVLGAILLALACLPHPAAAEPWTNAAGHAVEAELVGLDRGVAHVVRPDGSRLDLALASLAEPEQARALALCHEVTVPESVAVPFAHAARSLRRLTALFAHERMDGADYRERRAILLQRFDAACAAADVTGASREALAAYLGGL